MTRVTRTRLTLWVLLGLTLLRLPLAALMRLLLPDESVAPEVNHIAMMAQTLLMFALPGWLLMCGEKPEPVSKGHLNCLLLAGAAAVLAKLALPALNTLWCGLLSLEMPQLPVAQGVLARALQLLAVAVVPAIAEELFFRGALLRNLQLQYGRHTALWLTTLLFALMHGTPGGLPGHIVISLLLTLLAMHSGSLWAPVTVHLAYNLLPLQMERGALGALLLLAVLLALLIRRVPAGGIRPRGREALVCGAILLVMAVQYFV